MVDDPERDALRRLTCNLVSHCEWACRAGRERALLPARWRPVRHLVWTLGGDRHDHQPPQIHSIRSRSRRAGGRSGHRPRADAPPASRTIRAVFHGDVPTFDPVWTTANMSAYHGAMVYDTLFGVDAKREPQPQMVGKHGLSRRPADLDVRAARRPQVPRRHAGDRRAMWSPRSAAGRRATAAASTCSRVTDTLARRTTRPSRSP